ncbi:MAG: tetratricopeptide repeat protein, partial [Chloroflexota bacterium]
VARRIILEKPESRFDSTKEYTFRNSLYHDVAYAMLPRAYRVSHHQQAAKWFSGVTTTYPDALGLLAEHYNQAEQPLDAVKSYTAAAEYHYQRGQLVETLTLIENGLKSGGKLPREIALPYASHLWLLKGRVAHTRRRYSEATADSQTALMLMNELPDDQLVSERVQASVTLGNAYSSLGNYEDALEALTRSYQLINDVSDPSQQAAVLRAFGGLFWARGSLQEAELYQRRALMSAEASGDVRSQAATNAILGRIFTDKGLLGDALATFESVYETNKATESLLYQTSDLRHLANIHRLLFDYETAQSLLDEATALTERLNYVSPLIHMTQGLVSIGVGEPEKGIVFLRAAMANEYYNTYDRYNVHLSFLRGLATTGHWEECVTEGQMFVESVEKHTPVLYGRGLLWMGLAQHALGSPEGQRTLHWAMDNEQTYGGRDLWMCHYALHLAAEDETIALEHQQASMLALAERSQGLRNRKALRARATDPTLARQVFAVWAGVPNSQ